MINPIKRIFFIIGGIRLLPHLIVFLFLNKRLKRIILYDFDIWLIHAELSCSRFLGILILLQMRPELRSIYYYRIGRFQGWLCALFFPGRKNLFIWTKKIGGGFYIGHGWSTVINAKEIGQNCSVYQNVTIGSKDGKEPIIGNNVVITAHSVVLGNIRIGNDVMIGAGSIVVKSVSNSSVVVPSKSSIIKQKGIRVNIPL